MIITICIDDSSGSYKPTVIADDAELELSDWKIELITKNGGILRFGKEEQ